MLADLADPPTRTTAAKALAASLGVLDLIIFTPDPGIQLLLPAPGFPQTLPDSAAWQSLLRAAAAAGRATGPVRIPGAGEQVESLAVAGRDGSVVVLVGGTVGDSEVEWLRTLLPLLAATFRGERSALTAEGQAQVARAAAAQAEALAASLDRARRELGEALRRAKETAEENARLYDALRESDARKTEFLATLAHELRNPLAPIRTGIQVLKLAPDRAAAERSLGMMERQLGHMVRLIDDLLDLSRITRGKLELRKEWLDLATVLSGAVEASQPAISAGRHEFAVHLPEGPIRLYGDATRLAQVFSNLLTNAAKYTPDGGRIELAARTDGASVAVTVRDNGIGIQPDVIPTVFEMFVQVGQNSERAPGGLGIGLAIVRRLVEMHGGVVEAQSEGLGRGSTFCVRLPVAASENPFATAGANGSAVQATVPKSFRVLVVDDNVDGAESLAMLLDMRGHATKMAHDGPDAVAAVRDFRPELVFLDIGLPGFDGNEVARRIRAGQAGCQPVLVALTGWGTEEDRRKTREAGFDHHLTKPVGPAELEAALGRVTR